MKQRRPQRSSKHYQLDMNIGAGLFGLALFPSRARSSFATRSGEPSPRSMPKEISAKNLRELAHAPFAFQSPKPARHRTRSAILTMNACKRPRREARMTPRTFGLRLIHKQA